MRRINWLRSCRRMNKDVESREIECDVDADSYENNAEWDAIAPLFALHSNCLIAPNDAQAVKLFTCNVKNHLECAQGGLIEWAAQQLVSMRFPGDSLLELARDSACSSFASPTGKIGKLFSIPLVFDQKITDPHQQKICVEFIEQALISQGLNLSPSGFYMHKGLFTQDYLCEMGLDELHGLCKDLLDQVDADAYLEIDGVHAVKDTWNEHVLGNPRHLYWVVGFCFYDEKQPNWIGHHGDIDDTSIMSIGDFCERASCVLSYRLSKHVEVGRPANLIRQVKEGAFNEAAQALLQVCRHMQTEAPQHTFKLKVSSLNDAPIEATNFSLESKEIVTINLLATGFEEPLVHLQFICRSIDLDSGINDLIGILPTISDNLQIDFSHHKFSSDDIIAKNVIVDEDESWMVPEWIKSEQKLKSSSGRIFIH